MTSFVRRPLTGPDTLGERFRQVREERRVTLEEAAKAVSIPAKYLAAIEAGRHDLLPGLVYARNFVRQYAKFLEISDSAALEKFTAEDAIVRGNKPQAPRLVPRANTDFPWYIRYGRFIIGGVAILMVGGYLVWQVMNLVKPPELEVTDPAGDIATSEPLVTIIGQTDPAVTVRINNQQTEVDRDGNFRETINLEPGLNTLKITADRKYSQTAVVERRILLEQKE